MSTQPSSSQRQAAHYHKVHDEYAAHYYDAASMRYRDEFFFDIAFEGLSLDHKLVADLACGSGHNSVALLERFPTALITGFDISARACEDYQAVTGRPAMHLDLTAGHYEGPEFDAALIIGGIHHCVADIPGTLRTLGRMLKPGAILIMIEPNKRCFLELARRLWYRADRYFEESTEGALDPSELLQQAGGMFEAQNTVYRGGPAYFLILNSLVLRIPLKAKNRLAPPLFLAERAFNRLPGRSLFPYFIARWRRLPTPITGRGAGQLIDRIKEQKRSVRLRRAARLLVAGAVFGVALYYLLHVASGVDLGRVLAATGNAKLTPLAAAVACQVGFLLCQSFRWRVLLPKLMTIGMVRTVGLLSIGNMINMLLPLRSGDIARPFLAVRRAGTPLSRALAAAIAERALDVVVLGALAVVVPLQLGLQLYWASVAIVGGALLLAWVLRRSTLSQLGATRPRGALSAALGWLERACRTASDAFADIADARAVVLAVTWTIASFAFAMGTYVASLLALDIRLPPLSLMSLFVITQLGSAVPSVPASIGVFDALAVVLLVSAGISDEQALSGTLLLHAVLVAVPVGVGLAATAFEGGSILHGMAPAEQLLDKRNT